MNEWGRVAWHGIACTLRDTFFAGKIITYIDRWSKCNARFNWKAAAHFCSWFAQCSFSLVDTKWISYWPKIECGRMMTMDGVEKKKRKSIDVQSANEGSRIDVRWRTELVSPHNFFFFCFLLAGLVGVRSRGCGHVRNLSSPIWKPSQIAPNYISSPTREISFRTFSFVSPNLFIAFLLFFSFFFTNSDARFSWNSTTEKKLICNANGIAITEITESIPRPEINTKRNECAYERRREMLTEIHN